MNGLASTASLSRYSTQSDPAEWLLVVRARLGRLSRGTLWPTLGGVAAIAEEVSFDRSALSEQMVVSFSELHMAALIEPVIRVTALPWVIDAWFSP